ncbi:MAG: hypothetical protein IJZ06_09440 [Bacteroidales bacterium]|nr:hypothetical protein [Bacteroidales bacterium]
MDFINIALILLLVMMALSLFIQHVRDRKQSDPKNNNSNDNELSVVSSKLLIPLKIQAYERLLLYIERIQFPVLVKRIFNPAISRNDFQFSLLQNVEDEFEHNLAQRLYVSENTWSLVVLAKEEVLQNINAVFNDNPDADIAMIAQKLASFNNPMVEKAVISIKQEFNAL